MKRLLMISVFIALVPAAAFAQFVQVHIFHTNHSGAIASQFRVEVLNYSATHLGDYWSVPTAIGTSTSGVSLGYGSCMTEPIYLGYAYFYIAAATCSDFRVVADPTSPSGQIEVVDCFGGISYLSHGYDFRLDYEPCRVPPPGGTHPPDGAVAVPLDPTLVWTWEWNNNCPEGIGLDNYRVYFGSDPGDLGLAGFVMSGINELAVGPLSPATTYYWSVKVYDDYSQCPGLREQMSPVYSFATEGAVPVEPTTWGRIKSLYQ